MHKLKLKKPTGKQIIEYIVIAAIIIATVLMFILLGSRSFSYRIGTSSSVEYVSARVESVVSEDLSELSENAYTTGRQVVKVLLLEGNHKGETVEITNYITPTFQVILKQGSSVIVRADAPEGLEPYYSIYSHNQTFPVFTIVLFFLVLVVIIGRKKGFLSCVGLLFTLAMVVCYLLPEIYEGANAFITIFVTVMSSSAVTCFCISGFSKKTGLNLISIILGSASAVLLYWIFMLMLNLNGSAASEAENLLLISYATDLDLTGVLFAGVTVSALGAVMDVAVSLGASLSEIKDINPAATPKELFRSGMNIGRDMIGTMTNTLILAFAGGAFASMLIFISYGVQFHQLLSSNFLALEIATGIAGSAAVVLTVPISSAICAFGLGYSKTKRGN